MNPIYMAMVAIVPIAAGAVTAAFAMRRISVTALDGMTRQPEIAPQLIGMALVEALAIYTLVVTLVIAGKIVV
jgi:F0F1-type ATP synthase membrane subunit c/vacuolar-type H+-ATPase subunit K